MANPITETVWHGNPRPVEAFAWASASLVVSPYYADGRMVPDTVHGVDANPYITASDAVTQDQDVKLAEGSVLFTGPVKAGDAISINWITFGDLGNQNRGAAGVFPEDMDANAAAALFGRFISGNVDTVGSAVGALTVLTPTNGQDEIQVGVTTFTPVV
jgi:hypothetical protein